MEERANRGLLLSHAKATTQDSEREGVGGGVKMMMVWLGETREGVRQGLGSGE